MLPSCWHSVTSSSSTRKYTRPAFFCSTRCSGYRSPWINALYSTGSDTLISRDRPTKSSSFSRAGRAVSARYASSSSLYASSTWLVT